MFPDLVWEYLLEHYSASVSNVLLTCKHLYSLPVSTTVKNYQPTEEGGLITPVTTFVELYQIYHKAASRLTIWNRPWPKFPTRRPIKHFLGKIIREHFSDEVHTIGQELVTEFGITDVKFIYESSHIYRRILQSEKLWEKCRSEATKYWPELPAALENFCQDASNYGDWQWDGFCEPDHYFYYLDDYCCSDWNCIGQCHYCLSHYDHITVKVLWELVDMVLLNPDDDRYEGILDIFHLLPPRTSAKDLHYDESPHKEIRDRLYKFRLAKKEGST